LREPFQSRAKRALGTARPPGYAAQLPLVASQKTDHQVRFLKRVTAEHEGIAHSSRHIWKFQSITWCFGRALREGVLTTGLANSAASHNAGRQ
jgi:hypothetical protein